MNQPKIYILVKDYGQDGMQIHGATDSPHAAIVWESAEWQFAIIETTCNGIPTSTSVRLKAGR